MTDIEGPMAPAPSPDRGDEAEQGRLNDIVVRGPAGTFAVVGVATGLVVAIWFAFYFFVYLPRGVLQ